MGYPLDFALRYLGSRKRASISVGTAFAILGVALGVAALATIMSVTGGFHEQFRQKVLGVNAHVLVLKYSTNFREYRSIMDQVVHVDGVVGVAPFSINPMMITHGDATATGVLVKGVDPRLSLGVHAPAGDEWGDRFQGLQPVLDLPEYVVSGSLDGLRKPGAKPPERPDLDLPTSATPGELGNPTLAPPSLDDPEPGDEDHEEGAGGGDPHSRRVREILRDASGDDAGAPAAASAAPPPISPPPPLAPPSGAPDAGSGEGPQGSVVPDGGYSSVLPEDDELPDEIDPDLCADPEAVLKMPGIVVGISLARTLELELDDCLTVTSPTIGFSFTGGEVKPPVAKRFRVIAMFEAGFDQYDSKLVYTDLYEAQTFYDHGDTVTGVEMRVDDIDRAGEISALITDKLSSGLYHTMDWEELNHGLFTALRIQQILMSAVLALIIVVAAFTVIATLIMVVLDKTKEISVLKAMGATDGEVLRIFLYQGGIIGIGGTLLGLLLGFAVCKGLLIYGFPLDPKVYFISRLPVQVRPLEFIITGVIAILICLMATIVPSLYAANVRPADGFRNQ